MLKQILFIAAVVPALILTAAEPSIYVSFDQSVRADFGGTGGGGTVAGLSSPVGVIPALRTVNGKGTAIIADQLLTDGLSGKAYPVGKLADGTINTLRYNITPALKAAEGSVSFWVKPLDWDGSQRGDYRHFFSAKSDRGGSHWLFIYKHPDTDTIFFVYGTQGKKMHIARAAIKSWKPNEWHHIGATWSKDALVLYLDGKQSSAIPMTQVMPQDLQYFLVGEYWNGKPGSTLIDELRIFDTALKGDDMRQEYERLAAKAQGPQSLMVVTVGRKTAVPDGKIAQGEYASVIGAMRNFRRSNTFSVLQSKCHYAWDEQNLYFAVTSPGSGLRCTQSGRDAAVFTDDSVELYLKSGRDLYQFVVNSNGSFFDARNEDSAWNSQEVKIASRNENGTWTIELAIPWKNFGITPKDGTVLKFNSVRNFAAAKELTQIAAARSSFSEVSKYADLHLSADAPAYDISEMGNVFRNELDFRLSVLPTKTEKIRLRFDADAAIFAVNTDQSFDVTAGQPFTHQFKRRLPENSTLVCSLEIPGKGMLYKTAVDYRAPEALKLWYIYTDLKKAELVFVLRNNALFGGKNQVKVDFVTPGNKKLVHTQTVTVPDDKPVIEARFPLAPLAAGRYNLEYALMDGSGKSFYNNMEEYEYFKNGAYWDGIRDGLEDTLPDPWTPVSGKKNVFNCWGRTVTFGNGFISSIISAGEELLASPVQLKINGKAEPFRAECIASKPTMATFRLTPVSKEIPVSFTVKCEFDGFMDFEAQVAPNTSVKSLALEIPMRKKMADAFDDCYSCHYKNSLKGNVTLQINTVQKPFFWCGSEVAGLMGGSGTKHGWHVRNKSRGMTVKADAETTLLTINIADTAYRTGEKGEMFSFYLNPTPVKPLKEFAETPYERKNMIMSGASSARFFCYYHPDYFDSFWKWVLTRIKRDGRTTPDKVTLNSYHCPKGASPLSPAWNYYCQDWVNPPPGLGQYSLDSNNSDRATRDHNTFTYGCLNSKSFFDHQIMCAKNTIEGKQYGQYDPTTMYFDLAWPKNCGNAHHGCAWKDEFGDTQNDNDLYALRQYYLRVYRMLKKKASQGYFLGHIFYARTPADNFFDFAIAGEMYDRKVCKNSNYYDVFDPELMRIAYTCRANETAFGLIPQFLRSLECYAPERKSQWNPLTPKNDRAVRYFIAYCAIFRLTHCYDVWDAGQKLPPAGKGQVEIWCKAYDKLGAKKSYKRDLATVPADPKVISAVYGGNDKKLVAVVNDSDVKKSFTVAVDSELLTGKEIFSGQSFKAENGVIRLTLDARESAMILFE